MKLNSEAFISEEDKCLDNNKEEQKKCKMRFVILGDSKGKDNGINKKVLNKILKNIKKLEVQPDYIVHLGDSVAGSCDTEVLKNQLKDLHEIIGSYYPLDIILPVVGNHEVNNHPVDSKAEEVFEQHYAYLNLENYLEDYYKTAYYKDMDNVRCIFLNSDHYGEKHRITGKQLEWFKEVAEKDMPLKVVFVHCPPFPTGAHIKKCLDNYPEERDQFWKVVDQCKIDVVFCGHEHNYSRRVIGKNFNNCDCKYCNEITQVITGGAGEKLKNSFKSKEGVIVPPKDIYHYLILDIEGTTINVEVISIKGKVIDRFTISK